MSPKEHRYDQFCPIARASEVLAQRWTPLIARELLIGPQRFSDLKQRLRGISASVLTERLTTLEAQGLVAQRTLPPPAASTVYEMTALGRELAPVLDAMVRFGVRLLDAPRPGDHVEPDWFVYGASLFLTAEPCPARRFEIVMTGGQGPATLRVAGGPDGARSVEPAERGGDFDLRCELPVVLAMGLAAGGLPPDAVRGHPEFRVEEGDPRWLDDLPALFDMPPISERPTTSGSTPDPQENPS